MNQLLTFQGRAQDLKVFRGGPVWGGGVLFIYLFQMFSTDGILKLFLLFCFCFFVCYEFDIVVLFLL